MDLRLDSADLGLVATTAGGAIWRFFAKRDGREVPLFREPPPGPERTASRSGCFPLVPFGNRVRGNRFTFEGQEHKLAPNMRWDRHHLHGDGWIGEWQVLEHGVDRLRLGFAHRGRPGTSYAYTAEQSFALEARTLTLMLSVVNAGEAALPFGLGWHPYLPLTPETTLQSRTRSYWDEDEAWLPTRQQATAGDLDFAAGGPLPRRWINTQFEGWDGYATIRWPEQRIVLGIEADPVFDRCLIFVSDPVFDPGYDYGFFCFEPMSHSIDDHNKADAGGLRRLAPGERLAGAVRFTLADLPGIGVPA